MRRIVFLAIWALAAFLSLEIVSADEGFHFVQISDTHFGRHDHEERRSRIVETINDLPMEIECVVHTGDIFSDNIGDKETVDESVAILERIEAPLHCLPGNHDILKRRHAATARIYQDRFGEYIYSAEYEGVVFVFIYTEPLAAEFSVENYLPFDQLEKQLERSDGKPVLLFHHTPSVEDFYNNRMHSGWREDVRRRWIDLVNKYNVKAVVAGHFHRDELHWLGDVPLYVSSSIAGFWGRQASFRIYEYRDGKLGYRTQYLRPEKRN